MDGLDLVALYCAALLTSVSYATASTHLLHCFAPVESEANLPSTVIRSATVPEALRGRYGALI